MSISFKHVLTLLVLPLDSCFLVFLLPLLEKRYSQICSAISSCSKLLNTREWTLFCVDEMEESRDLDELIVAHERYLNAFVEKSFLGERSHHLYKTLFSLLSLFDLIFML